MKLAELFPALSAAALRLRHEGEPALAGGLEALVLKLADHGEDDVENLPLKAAKKSARRPSPKQQPDASESEAFDRLTRLLAQARDLPLEDIRRQISIITTPVPLATLRKACKAILHLPLSNRSKNEIEDLLYGHIARRKERTSW